MQIATPFNALQLWVQVSLTSYACTQIATPSSALRLIRLTLSSHLTPVRRLQRPHQHYGSYDLRCPHILRLYADCNSKDAQNYKMPARILCAEFQTVHTQFTLPRVSTTFRGKNYAYCLDSRTMSCPDLVRTSQLFCGSFRFALHF